MENASLVGLSRQIAVQRELDVVANNIANVNTTGYKADNVVFHEFLMPAARANAVPRQRPPGELRAGPRDLARPLRKVRCSRPATRSTSRSAATPSSPCRRRAASATRATARCRSTARASSSPPKACRSSARTGRSCSSRTIATSRSASTARSRCARARTPPTRSAASSSSRASTGRGCCRRTAPRPTRRRTACTAQAAGADVRVNQGAIEKSNVNSVMEMTRMVEVTRTYTQVASMLQNQSDMRRTAIEKLAEVPTLSGTQEIDHASPSHRRHRHEGARTQRSGDLEQHRQHAHDRLQAPARRIPGPALRARAPRRHADLRPGQPVAGRHRARRRRQDGRHAAPDDAGLAGADRQGLRRRDPRRRLLPDHAARRPHRLYARRLVRARLARAHRHRARQRGESGPDASRRTPRR